MDRIGIIISIMRYGVLFVLAWFLWLLLTAIRQDLRQKPEVTSIQTENQLQPERQLLRSLSGGVPSLALEVVVSTCEQLLPGQLFLIRHGISIGRERSNDIIVEDAFTSNKHARLWTEAGNTLVEDLGSTNGTFLNGSRLSVPATINLGDLLKVGGSTFRLIG